MTNNKLAVAILVSCVALPSLVRAQSAVDSLRAEAAAMGVDIDSVKASPIPDRKATQPAVPQEFSGAEPVSYSGTAVTLWYALGAQITDNVPWTNTATFEEVSDRVMAASKSRAYPARRAGQTSSTARRNARCPAAPGPQIVRSSRRVADAARSSARHWPADRHSPAPD